MKIDTNKLNQAIVASFAIFAFVLAVDNHQASGISLGESLFKLIFWMVPVLLFAVVATYVWQYFSSKKS